MTHIEHDLDFRNAGFNEDDMGYLGLYTDPINTKIEEVTETIQQFEDIKQAVKDSITPEEKSVRLEAAKSVREQVHNSSFEELDTVVTLSFSTTTEKQNFMEKCGYPIDDKLIKGEVFAKKMNI